MASLRGAHISKAVPDGGREALMEAQRFPADYDGIVAGAPINAFTRYMDGILSMQQALAEPGGYVPPKKLPAIEAAIEGACARSLPMSPVLRAHFAFPSRAGRVRRHRNGLQWRYRPADNSMRRTFQRAPARGLDFEEAQANHLPECSDNRTISSTRSSRTFRK
jgi:hypothetical protein